jgi:hypothetical protein
VAAAAILPAAVVPMREVVTEVRPVEFRPDETASVRSEREEVPAAP